MTGRLAANRVDLLSRSANSSVRGCSRCLSFLYVEAVVSSMRVQAVTAKMER